MSSKRMILHIALKFVKIIKEYELVYDTRPIRKLVETLDRMVKKVW